MKAKIPLTKPFIPKATKQAISEVLDSGWLTEGKKTKEFQDRLRDYIGCKYVLCVPNATIGLELALRAFGIGPGSKVIVPDFTYPATILAIMNVGAQPILCDVDENTFLIKFNGNVRTPSFSAIMPVSQFGNPLDYDYLRWLAGRYGMKIIEDAACSLGSEWNGEKVGNLADATIFSFHPRKILTTGEGGAVATNNKMIFNYMQKYKHFGMNDKGLFCHEGNNFKISDILSVIGLGQMDILDAMIKERNGLASRYHHGLKGCPIGFQWITKGGRSNFQTYCIKVKNRKKLKDHLADKEIETQIGSFSLSMQPAFQGINSFSSLENSQVLSKSCLALPLYYGMKQGEQDRVIKAVRDFYN